ncbi:hypothetical protein [Neptuniibacter sp.]|uniref:hypothetical protein n=1 Tax=Neptuniibacter sp. TaxID=1962643 RepID=UPI0026247510|nr:hypothetical protein [Neptuniibacter sp.]MCP4596187.1 hypothetical protein [Neptuniibacter sp.]
MKVRKIIEQLDKSQLQVAQQLISEKLEQLETESKVKLWAVTDGLKTYRFYEESDLISAKQKAAQIIQSGKWQELAGCFSIHVQPAHVRESEVTEYLKRHEGI